MGIRVCATLCRLGPVLAALLSSEPAEARKQAFAGPVEAVVVDVLDGDTFLADALVWPGQTIRVNVRIRGIDAPEMKSRCNAEHLAALKARDALAALLADGSVSISNIGGAKYYGRVLADVETASRGKVAPILLARALVRPYGGGRRAGWCG
jgi:micrococcal nuclease